MGDTNFRRTGRRTRKGPFSYERRDERRTEGEARNAAWLALSREAKIASLRGRRGESKRQLSRLVAQGGV
jgi:hypothetical protein